MLHSNHYQSPRIRDEIKTRNTQGWIGIHECLLEMKAPSLRTMLTKHDVNAAASNGRTPLHVALNLTPVYHETIKTLVQAGANLNQPDYKGWTPLHEAVAGTADADTIRLLLEYGADPTATTKSGYAPLSLLVNYVPTASKIEAIVEYGGNVNMQTHPNGLAPLHEAIRASARVEVVRCLIRLGADVNSATKDGFVPLSFAAAAKYDAQTREAVIQTLLDAGASLSTPFAPHASPLKVAFHNKFADLASIKLLASRSGTGRLGQGDLQEVLRLATENHREDVVRHALELGGDPCLLSEHDGWSPLHVAMRSGCGLEVMLRAGADPNVPTSKGVTPLSLAMSPTHSEGSSPHAHQVTKLLLEFGAEANQCDAHGWTPLLEAVYQKQPLNLVELLLLKGQADPNAQNSRGSTPLSLAMSSSSPTSTSQQEYTFGLTKLLLTYGADANFSDAHGWTPLFEAVHQKKPLSVVELLLSKGKADPNKANDKGIVLLNHALSTRASEEVVSLLLKFGAKPTKTTKGGAWSSVHTAVQQGYSIELIERLFSLSNEPVDAISDSNLTALMLSLFDAKTLFLTEHLLETKKADPNLVTKSKSPMHVAAKVGNLEGMKLLLKHGGDPNLALEPQQDSQHDNGHTVLMDAVNADHHASSMVELLLSHGADPNKRIKGGWTPLHVACKLGDLASIKALVETGKAQVNAVVEGQLHHMPLIGFLQSPVSSELMFQGTKLLLDHGADANPTDPKVIHPLSALIVRSNTADSKTLELLLKAGADPNTKSHGGFPALTMCFSASNEAQRLEFVKTLLAYGADPNAQDQRNTVLYAAILRHASLDVVEELLKAGADLTRCYVSALKLVVNQFATSNHGNKKSDPTEMIRLLIKYAPKGSSRQQSSSDDLFTAQCVVNLALLRKAPEETVRLLREEAFATSVTSMRAAGGEAIESDGSGGKRKKQQQAVVDLRTLLMFSDDPDEMIRGLNELKDKGKREGLERLILQREGVLRRGVSKHGHQQQQQQAQQQQQDDGWNLLHMALQNPKTNLQVLTMLLDAGCDPNAKSRSGLTPLVSVMHHPNLENRLAFTNLLLQRGADPSKVAPRGSGSHTLLEIALSNGADVATVSALLRAGAAASETPRLLKMAVMEMMNREEDPTEMVELLLSHGAAEIHLRGAEEGASQQQLQQHQQALLHHNPLKYAVFRNAPTTVVAALERAFGGKDAFSVTRACPSALVAAPPTLTSAPPAPPSEDEDEPTTSTITSSSCSILSDFVRKTDFSSSSSLDELARLLASTTAADDASAALVAAVLNPTSTSEVVSLLLEHGADVNVQAKPTGRTPLMLALNHPKSERIVSALVAGGKLDVNLPDARGNLALGYAVVKGDSLENIEAILKAGANLSLIKFNLVETIICQSEDESKRERTERLVKLLLEHGADPRKRENNGKTCSLGTYYAKRKHLSEETVRALDEAFVAFDARKTSAAVRKELVADTLLNVLGKKNPANSFKDVVRFLDANVNTLDVNLRSKLRGVTPLMLALKHPQSQLVVKLLLQRFKGKIDFGLLDAEGNSLSWHAVRQGNLENLRAILRASREFRAASAETRAVFLGRLAESLERRLGTVHENKLAQLVEVVLDGASRSVRESVLEQTTDLPESFLRVLDKVKARDAKKSSATARREGEEEEDEDNHPP